MVFDALASPRKRAGAKTGTRQGDNSFLLRVSNGLIKMLCGFGIVVFLNYVAFGFGTSVTVLYRDMSDLMSYLGFTGLISICGSSGAGA
ncbi:hypothetical protein F2Q70_00003530 [Brassica cretica]|uniref:Uncharacterized protein n=1 Tax=Brassica cretica TaxID=69181 RepID=A0A3N6R4L8_BRACR|nr:hypothetical protein F2Q70_00003530 [Brassica cretica]KAF3569643.1 hypothetical protein DY000_02015424 [Brassica cretica]